MRKVSGRYHGGRATKIQAVYDSIGRAIASMPSIETSCRRKNLASKTGGALQRTTKKSRETSYPLSSLAAQSYGGHD